MCRWIAVVLAIGATVASAGCVRTAEPVLTFAGSVVGREADVIRGQLRRFEQAHPSLKVALRATPDAADQRHQLYVQWLTARAGDPDVLQLDVVWTPEFAAAGWIASLDRFRPPVDRFFAAADAADRWNGALYALPWFIDVGMPVLPAIGGSPLDRSGPYHRVRERGQRVSNWGGPRFGDADVRLGAGVRRDFAAARGLASAAIGFSR